MQVMAEVMGSEAALVRVQLVSGTHAIATALFACLRPGDTLLAVAGRWALTSRHLRWRIATATRVLRCSPRLQYESLVSSLLFLRSPVWKPMPVRSKLNLAETTGAAREGGQDEPTG